MSENNGMNNQQWEDPTPKVRAKGKGPLMGIAAVGLAAVVGIGVFASGMLGNVVGGKPSDQVSKALGSLFEGEENKFMEDWVGGPELSKNMMKASSFSGNLELVDFPALTQSMGLTLPQGIRLSFEGANDTAAKSGSGKISLGLMGANFLGAEFFGSDAKMQMAIPAMFKEVITADLTGDLAAKIKSAPLFKSLSASGDPTELEEAITMFTQSLKSGQTQSDQMTKMLNGELNFDEYKGLVDTTKTFQAKWVIEKVDNKTVTFNGKAESFPGYVVTIKKADYITYLKDMKTYVLTDEKFKNDFTDRAAQQMATTENITKDEAYTKLDQELSGAITKLEAEPMAKDLTFTVHMTKDNVLVSMTMAYEVTDAKINVSIERNGGDFLNQNATLKVNVEGKDSGSMEVSSTGKTEANVQTRQIKLTGKMADSKEDGAVTFDSSINKDTGAMSVKAVTAMMMADKTSNLEMVMNGKLENIVKDKSGAIVLDEMKLTMDNETVANFKAEFKYDTQNVVVKPLEGTPLDLFTATETDMNSLMEQIQSNLGGLLQLIGMPLGL